GERGHPRDRSDGVRRTPRSADGQQYGGADATRTGGGPEELLRQRIGVERPPRSDDVLAAADAVPVGPEPAAVASCLPASVRRGRRSRSLGRGAVPAVEPQPGAETGVG